MKIYKIAKKPSKNIILYRGESVHNKGGKYWTPDKEWARQFTQSGLDSEIRSVSLSESLIYVSDRLPMATSENEINEAIKKAKELGFKAILVDEGIKEPNSVLII